MKIEELNVEYDKLQKIYGVRNQFVNVALTLIEKYIIRINTIQHIVMFAITRKFIQKIGLKKVVKLKKFKNGSYNTWLKQYSEILHRISIIEKSYMMD